MEEKRDLQGNIDQEENHSMDKQTMTNETMNQELPANQVTTLKPEAQTDQMSLHSQIMKKPKKKHGCLITVLAVFAVLVVAAAGLYFFMPGLRKPNDLGVKASQDAYESAIRKLTAKTGSGDNSLTNGTTETTEATDTTETKETASEEYSSSYEATEVSAALTSEEVTSLLTINRPEDYPLQDTQVRLNEDDTMEVSSSVSVDFLLEDILDNEITKEEIAAAVPVLKDLPEDVNVYLKLNADVENNEVETFDIENISVMGVKLPDSMIGTADAGTFITDSINNYLDNKAMETGERYDVLQVEDGNLVIEGAINLP